MSVGPIPVSKIRQLSDRLRLDEDNEMVLVKVISCMDSTYLRIQSEEMKRKTDGR